MQVPRVAGLKELAGSYDAVMCDVWGVVHNGVNAFPAAVAALTAFRGLGKEVILITNAPRPAPPIREQLAAFGVSGDAYDDIVTSGDVTREVIAARPGVRLFHIGPERDLSFYDDLDVVLAGEAEAELVSCTGLFDDTVEKPEDYRPLLEGFAGRGIAMVCANPDIVVERGHTLVWCAGAIAELYAEMGGEVILVGKPHAPIYDAAKARLGGDARRILAIGDGLGTDVLGAVRNGLDVLFVTAGIHSADFGPVEAPDPDRVRARLQAEGLAAVAFMPLLAWE